MALQLLLELLVVFSGVYAAFALSELQQEREASERREQIRSALVREIQYIRQNTSQVARNLPEELGGWESLVSAGRQPPMIPLLNPFRFETHMWDATIASGGLDLLDVETVYRVSRFYNELNLGIAQMDQLRSLSETLILPNLNQPESEFYVPATGALRPTYRGYMDGMWRLSGLAASITAAADDLLCWFNARPEQFPVSAEVGCRTVR